MPGISSVKSQQASGNHGNQPLTHYINTYKKTTHSDHVANAYSLQMKNIQKDHSSKKNVKKTEPWRDSLSVLRTIPKPVEQNLLKAGSLTGSNLSQFTSKDNNTDYTSKDIIAKNAKGKEYVRVASGISDNQLKKALKASELPNKSFKEIMDPYVSTEKRYENYLKDLQAEDLGDNNDFDQYNPLRIETEFLSTEEGLVIDRAKRSRNSMKHKDSEPELMPIVPTNSPDRTGRRSTLGIIDTVACANDPPPPQSNHKTPCSHVGRVSSLGLDGRMSITGNDHYKSYSRISMNSTAYTNYDKDGQGYVYKSGEIHRKLLLPKRDNGASSSASREVVKDVKLMEYLIKNSKVLPVYNENKVNRKTVKPVFKTAAKKEEPIAADAKGGGWKILHGGGISNRKPDFDRMIPVSVVKLSCEIETQTD